MTRRRPPRHDAQHDLQVATIGVLLVLLGVALVFLASIPAVDYLLIALGGSVGACGLVILVLLAISGPRI